jgi:methionyl-tRNA synthetase
MIAKNCGGILPVPGAFTPPDQALLDAAKALYGRTSAEIDRQAFHARWKPSGRWWAPPIAMSTSRPLGAAQDRSGAHGHGALCGGRGGRRIAILIQPFMPESGAKLLDQLAVARDGRSFASLDQPLPGGITLPAPSGVFPRFVETTAA